MNEVFTAIAALAAAVSAIVAAYQARASRRTQKELQAEARKDSTIQAYNRLQDVVLDKIASYPKAEIVNIIRTIDEAEIGFESVPEINIAYQDVKALVAKCEHFAVGVNEGLYDIDLVNRMGGIHLIYLYKKVEPIIAKARENNKCCDYVPFVEFEKLVNKLQDHA